MILIPSIGSVFAFINFKVHQEEIVKNLCIQREMKVNKCNGHCYLSKQLKKEAEKEKKEAENLREKQELVYIDSSFENPVTICFSLTKSVVLFSNRTENPKSISFSIFRPPLV